MQDSVPLHRAKANQDFLRIVVPNLIRAEEWAPHSPDLNPLDYLVLDILQELVYEGRRQTYGNLHEFDKAVKQKQTR